MTVKRAMTSAERSIEELLMSSDWARSLADAEREAVIGSMVERTLESNEPAVRIGEPAEHWIGVIEGFVKLSMDSADGSVSSFVSVLSGGWFGEGSLLKSECWRYNAVAKSPTRLAMMPRQTFETLRAGSLVFNHYLQDLLNARLGLFIGLLANERLLDTDARVARSLAALYFPGLYPHPGSFIPLRQEEVGQLAGVSRQRAHIALHALQDAGLLIVERSGLTILDVSGLYRYAASPKLEETP